MRRFPVGQYGRQTLQFFPAPFRAPLRAFAALVFPWADDDHVLLCDIESRGWCIPSGRVEPNETSQEAARREAIEEAGAVLGPIDYLGTYHITERREVRWADVYVSRVVDLVEIGIPEESKGIRLATMEELPKIYHLWNELTEKVFLYSHEVMRRRKC